MASDIQKMYDIKDISFIDGITADTVLEEMISDYQEKYYELTGEYEVLGELDKFRILMNASTLKIYQAYQYIDRGGKMNLLKYSTGDFLLNLGANRSVTINEEKAATCYVEFVLSQVHSSVISIEAGTKVTSGDGVYFETEAYCEIPIGLSSITTSAICQVTGTVGNNYQIGQLNILAEPKAYIESVSNITISEGGEDLQSDEDFRKKIFLSPSGYSTAGPEDAYVYWVNECSTLIGDVKVISPLDDIVQIIVLKKNGGIPDEDFLEKIHNYLKNNNIKPMTEQIIVTAPTVVNYNISGTYYINKSDVNNTEAIHLSVSEAVNEYIKWQKEKIGRDLNPFQLQYLLAKAGVKRVNLLSPSFNDIDNFSIAIEGNIDLAYGGIEDD